MVNVISEICLKELKTRFGSKKVLFPLFISLGFPILVFIPRLQEAMTHTDPETEFIRLLFFLIIPTMVVTIVGITSFISEIRWKTIKPLLVAPISEGEILIGKSLACIIPGVLIEAILSVIIILSVQTLDLSILLLLFVIGPLSVIFTTFIFIIGVSKFPAIADGGGSILMPMGSISLVFLLFLGLKIILQLSTITVYIFLALILSLLIPLVFLVAKNLFNRETLVLSI
jgi:hypothetical protein